MPPTLGTLPPRPSQAALGAFSDRRHPSWAHAAHESPRSPPPSASRRTHRPSSQTPERPSRQVSRPAHRPSSSPVSPPRHPTWAAAAQRAEEEEAARDGRPPPFKPLDLTIPPPAYNQHTDDTRITPVL
ncbi:hypothetical protein [Absidia glauca]|uniref:Uncharacterized protein n=1 Tax=Absidia glauca TaxID=4829 RepID=A0A168RG88_ABSGL|nr:hypothetical protein [Absidia glauca]